MYQKLFHGVPTKPVLFLAPLVIAVALVFYYHSQYKRCTEKTLLREQLYSYLKNNVKQTISLPEAVPITWDKAVILVNYKPDREVPGCPFGWDWSKKYRKSLVEQNLLNVILYIRNKKRVNYIEFSRNLIDFESADAETPITPETAIFKVESEDTSNQHLLLKRVNDL